MVGVFHARTPHNLQHTLLPAKVTIKLIAAGRVILDFFGLVQNARLATTLHALLDNICPFATQILIVSALNAAISQTVRSIPLLEFLSIRTTVAGPVTSDISRLAKTASSVIHPFAQLVFLGLPVFLLMTVNALHAPGGHQALCFELVVSHTIKTTVFGLVILDFFRLVHFAKFVT